MSKKWTSKEVVRAVETYYGLNQNSHMAEEWASLPEFSAAPGMGRRRADIFLVRAWAGKPKRHERILIEVKVSRSDFLREMAKPEKMQEIGRLAHRTYFATPEGIIKDTDDLGTSGHLLVSEGKVRIVRRGTRNDTPDDLPEGTFVEAFRRASRAEKREEHAEFDPVAKVLQLERENASLQRKVQALDDKIKNTSYMLHAWENLIRKIGGVPCVCGSMLKKVKSSDLHAMRYSRIDHEDGSICPEIYPRADFEATVKFLLDQESVNNVT